MKIKRDEIIIRKAIIHILDCENGFMKTSNSLIELGPDLNEFLRGHIFRLIDSDDMKKCHFKKEASPVYSMLEEMDEKDDQQFIEMSKILAEQLFDIMCESIEIPSADLICVSFQMKNLVYLALLKMNYKDSYIHRQTDDSNDIIKQHIMPSTGTRLTEAILIDLNTFKIFLKEKKYDIQGEKINYLSERFLMCYTELAPKRKFNILTRTINNISNKYFSDAKKLETKSCLRQEFEESGQFDISKIGERLFGENMNERAEFDRAMERYDMQYDTFSVTNEKTVKSLEKQTLVTDTGIEIYVPMNEWDMKENVLITREEDGTQSILLRNIEGITVK